jgi:hypothetical protein
MSAEPRDAVSRKPSMDSAVRSISDSTSFRKQPRVTMRNLLFFMAGTVGYAGSGYL